MIGWRSRFPARSSDDSITEWAECTDGPGRIEKTSRLSTRVDARAALNILRLHASGHRRGAPFARAHSPANTWRLPTTRMAARLEMLLVRTASSRRKNWRRARRVEASGAGVSGASEVASFLRVRRLGGSTTRWRRKFKPGTRPHSQRSSAGTRAAALRARQTGVIDAITASSSSRTHAMTRDKKPTLLQRALRRARAVGPGASARDSIPWTLDDTSIPLRPTRRPARLPRDDAGPVFKEPWEAQAFAMTVSLHARRRLQLARMGPTHSPGSSPPRRARRGRRRTRYYEHWLAALEKLVAGKKLVRTGAGTRAWTNGTRRAWTPPMIECAPEAPAARRKVVLDACHPSARSSPRRRGPDIPMSSRARALRRWNASTSDAG